VRFLALDAARGNTGLGEDTLDAAMPVWITFSVKHLEDAIFRRLVEVFGLKSSR
jgi:hypothetical protein